jgi:hypothetical protein
MFCVVLSKLADTNTKIQGITLIDYAVLWALRLLETPV